MADHPQIPEQRNLIHKEKLSSEYSHTHTEKESYDNILQANIYHAFRNCTNTAYFLKGSIS